MNDVAIVLAKYAYQKHPEGITLSSGQTTHEYLDCRRAFGHAQTLRHLANEVMDHLNPWPDAVGGLALGAVPLAVACAIESTYTPYRLLRSFYVRDKRKAHGTSDMIEGAVTAGDRVCLVEDVVTTGESVITAVLDCQSYGLKVTHVVALVDRECSGLERIRNVTGPEVSIQALCTLSEIRAITSRG